MSALFKFKAPPAPKYCKTCGKPLVSDSMRVGFDPYTGEEMKQPTLYCPTLIATHVRWVWDDNDSDLDPYWRGTFF